MSYNDQIEGYDGKSRFCLTLVLRTASRQFHQFAPSIRFFSPLSTLRVLLSLIFADSVGIYWYFKVVFNKISSET